MKARCFSTAMLAMALLLAVAPAALAKGASAATIEGPGLERPISLRETANRGRKPSWPSCRTRAACSR
jgi:hypothetical protein